MCFCVYVSLWYDIFCDALDYIYVHIATTSPPLRPTLAYFAIFKRHSHQREHLCLTAEGHKDTQVPSQWQYTLRWTIVETKTSKMPWTIELYEDNIKGTMSASWFLKPLECFKISGFSLTTNWLPTHWPAASTVESNLWRRPFIPPLARWPRGQWPTLSTMSKPFPSAI